MDGKINQLLVGIENNPSRAIYGQTLSVWGEKTFMTSWSIWKNYFKGVTISTAARPISWLSRKQETENVSSTFFCIWRLKPSSNFCHWSCFRRMSRTSKIRVEVFASCAIKINHPWSNESHTKPKVSKLRTNVFCPCCAYKVGFAPNSTSKHPFVGKVLEGPV